MDDKNAHLQMTDALEEGELWVFHPKGIISPVGESRRLETPYLTWHCGREGVKKVPVGSEHVGFKFKLS